MKAIPRTPEIVAIAKRIIWFESPSRAISDPVRFLAYAMVWATDEDMRVIRRYVSDADFIEAIDNAPPGIVDARSCAYWNLQVAGRHPAPPLPTRKI